MTLITRLAAGKSLAALILFSTVVTPSMAQADTVAQVLELTNVSATVLDSDAAAVEEVDGWPANADENLPLAGIFYGNPYGGIGTANAPIAYESSRRFRAERTGNVSFVKYHNRILRDYEITARCGLAKNNPDNKYCQCKSAGLDAYSCGYTMNTYHVGNGGTIVVEVRPDNGNGYPSDEVLGKSEPFIPMNNQDKWYPELRFVNEPFLEAGRIYHLVFTNLTPPANCNLTNVRLDKAASCPRNQGAMALNGNFHLSDPPSTGRFGPYRGSKSATNLYRTSPDSGWSEFRNALAYYELRYADGVAVGDTSYGHEATRTGASRISGSVRARESFNVQDVSRNVNGLWLNFGHTESADGSAMNIELKNESGSVLYSGQLPASEYCLERRSNATTYGDYNCRDWGYLDFGKVITLNQGYSYSVELSAGSSAGFVVSTYMPFTSHGFRNRNHWFEARAQHSTDGGRSWNSWAGKWETERDLPMAFTIDGMPRQLP